MYLGKDSCRNSHSLLSGLNFLECCTIRKMIRIVSVVTFDSHSARFSCLGVSTTVSAIKRPPVGKRSIQRPNTLSCIQPRVLPRGGLSLGLNRPKEKPASICLAFD